MTRPLAEYTVRDYSAVDRQVEQIAERERQYTEKLKIRNYRQMTILCVGALLAFGLFLVLTAIAYRIAFPPKIEVIETTKVIEKTVTPKITILVRFLSILMRFSRFVASRSVPENFV